MAKKLCLFLTSVVLAVTLCFGIAACKKNKNKEKEAFSVPANVKVEGDTLKWDAVEGAAEYTVKINSDETTKPTTNSLNLTTVTAKLTAGANKLSVKANATDAKNESAYSAEVTYTYTPSGTVTQLATPEVTLSGDTLSWAAVTDAVGYTVKIGDATLDNGTATTLDLTSAEATARLVRGNNNISVKANAGTGHTDSEYSTAKVYNYVISAADEAEAFKTSVNAIGTVTLNSTNALTAAKAKYAVLSDDAKAVDGVTAAITTLTEKDCEYFALLVAEVGDVSASSTKAQLDAAKTAYDAANAYYATLISNSGAATAKTSLDGKKTAYDTAISTITGNVDTLAGEIDTLLAKDYTTTKPVLADYNALIAKEEAIAGLTEYAAYYWTETYAAKSASITAKKDEILAIPAIETNDIFVAIDGANGAVTILYSATNVLGKASTFATAPTITITIDGADENTYTDVQPTGVNNNVYRYTKTFVKDSNKTDGYEAKITYTVGGCEQEEITYTAFLADRGFDETNGFEIVKDNALLLQGDALGVGAEATLDIYRADDITVGDASTLPTVNGYPLIKGVTVTNGMTVEAFRSLLARTYRDLLVGNGVDEKVYEVRFVLYLRTEASGAITQSRISYSQVSHDTYTLNLTEDDVKVRLAYSQTGMTDADPVTGGITLGAGYDTNTIAAQFNDSNITAANVYNELRFIIDVTLDGTTKSFVMNCTENMTALDGGQLKRNIYNLFQNDTDNGYTLEIRLALREGSEYSDILKDSAKTDPKDWNLTVSEADTQLSINFGSTGNKVTLDTTNEPSGELAYGRWEVVTVDDAGYHDGLTMFVYEVTSDIDNPQTYDFTAATPFASYLHTQFSNISWSDINAQIDDAWAKLPAGQKTNQKQFVFVLQKLVNADGVSAGYADSVAVYLTNSSEARTVVTYNRNWTVPDGAQLRFTTNDGGCFEFLRENQPNGSGSIFSNGVHYIEIKFTADSHDYSAYLFNVEGTLKIYANTEKTGDSLSCDAYNNGWLHISDFNNWVNGNTEEYAALTSFDLSDGIPFYTKVHHDGTYYVGEGNYSTAITYPAA